MHYTEIDVTEPRDRYHLYRVRIDMTVHELDHREIADLCGKIAAAMGRHGDALASDLVEAEDALDAGGDREEEFTTDLQRDRDDTVTSEDLYRRACQAYLRSCPTNPCPSATLSDVVFGADGDNGISALVQLRNVNGLLACYAYRDGRLRRDKRQEASETLAE
jgi:hypothetical protein